MTRARWLLALGGIVLARAFLRRKPRSTDREGHLAQLLREGVLRIEALGAAGRVYPTITVSARRTNSGLQVFGTADLPEGTILQYEVGLPGLLNMILGPRRRGEVRLRDGRYEISFAPSPWSARELVAAVSVRADATQPPATQELLGRRGEKLAGDVSGEDYSEYFHVEQLAVEGEESSRPSPGG